MSTARYPGPCAIEGCDGGNYQSNYCSKHYQRMRKHGTPRPAHIPERRPTLVERFESKVDKTNHPAGCWIWQGQLMHEGYGVFSVGSKPHRAHRWAYQTFVREIPDGMVLDHLCRNRACVNPAHLDVVTTRENCLRGMSPTIVIRRLETCKFGHKIAGANVYNPPANPEHRSCRQCRKDRSRKAYLKKTGQLLEIRARINAAQEAS